MKNLIIILSLIFICISHNANAQSGIRKTMKDMESVFGKQSTQPQWQQKYNDYMLEGNFLMNKNVYSKAITYYNKALSIVPNSREAIIARNYCRSMLPPKTHTKRKS